MTDSNTESTFIFYLKLEPKLPRFYIHLSRALQEYGVTLVPVSPRELMDLLGRERAQVISFCSKLDSYKLFLQIRKSFLDLALLNNRISLLDVSSFGSVNNTRKDLRKGVTGRRSYYYLPLPTTVETVSISLMAIKYELLKDRDIWPGGKKSALPITGN